MKHVQETFDSVRSKERSFKQDTNLLPPCYVKKKVSSVLMTSRHASPGTTKAIHKNELVWMIFRGLYNGNATVPVCAGWVSRTAATSTNCMSNIGYMTQIFNQAYDYSTVQQCPMISMEATLDISRFTTLS